MVGVCLLLVVYLLLIARGLVITVQAQTLFGKLLAGSHHADLLRLRIRQHRHRQRTAAGGGAFPCRSSVTGSSLVTLMSGFGILMAVHTHRKWIAQA